MSHDRIERGMEGAMGDNLDSISAVALSRATRLGQTAPKMPDSFAVTGLERDDDGEMLAPNLGDWRPGRLAGASFGIEYVNASGDESVRRITAIKLRQLDGNLQLTSWCHERRAMRTFRLDRILSCHDHNGEVFETALFFRHALGLVFERLEEIVEPEDLFGPGMRLLAALAESDGYMHPDEVERVIQYCSAVLDRYGIAVTPLLGDCLPRLVRSQRPTPAIVEKSIRQFRGIDRAGRRLLLRYALEVMDADEYQSPEEFALMMRIKGELA